MSEDRILIIIIMVLALIQGTAAFLYFLYVKNIWRHIKFTYVLASVYIFYLLYGIIWLNKSPIHQLVLALLVAEVTQLCGLFVSFVKVEVSKAINKIIYMQE